MVQKIIEIEAESLEEAKAQAKSQTPRGFCVLTENVIADGRPKNVQAVAETIEAAFAKAQSQIPDSAHILEKKQVTAPDHKGIPVEASDEKDAELNAERKARQEFGSTAIVKGIRLVAAGRKGFLGIGAKPNQYEADILQQAVVEVTYKTSAKIRVEIGRKTYQLGLVDPHHPARSFLDEAARVADKTVELTTSMMTVNSIDAMSLVSAIDRAIEKEPDDLDLLVAKSGALCCAMQFKTAEEVIDQVLAIDPDHFEAQQRKAHWNSWKHVFQYAPWSTTAKTLHPVISAHFQHQHTVQLVRDGLQVGIAIIRPAQSREFPRGLPARTPSKWVPIWSDTPYGAIVAHYVVVADNPVDPWKGEGFLPVNVPDEAIPESGYWLLQRMCHVNSCFIVLTDGHNILHNSRYIFPDTLKATLSTISEKMARQPAGVNMMAFQRAYQWHMNNFDMARVR